MIRFYDGWDGACHMCSAHTGSAQIKQAYVWRHIVFRDWVFRAVMCRLWPCILVWPDGMLARVGYWNDGTRELGSILTILMTN